MAEGKNRRNERPARLPGVSIRIASRPVNAVSDIHTSVEDGRRSFIAWNLPDGGFGEHADAQ